jgi:hypothetical protein
MTTDTQILYVNQSSDENNESVLVLLQPHSEAAAIAWQVIANIGRNCWHKFTYTADTSIQVLWDGGRSGMFPVAGANGKSYVFRQTAGGFQLEENGSSSNPSEISVLNQVSTPGGISVVVLKDGNPILVKHEVSRDEEAIISLPKSLYFGIASDYQEGVMVNLEHHAQPFTAISTEGLKSLTVTRKGSTAEGYVFVTSDVIPA